LFFITKNGSGLVINSKINKKKANLSFSHTSTTTNVNTLVVDVNEIENQRTSKRSYNDVEKENMPPAKRLYNTISREEAVAATSSSLQIITHIQKCSKK
jgi:hypothetical protein